MAAFNAAQFGSEKLCSIDYEVPLMLCELQREFWQITVFSFGTILSQSLTHWLMSADGGTEFSLETILLIQSQNFQLMSADDAAKFWIQNHGVPIENNSQPMTKLWADVSRWCCQVLETTSMPLQQT